MFQQDCGVVASFAVRKQLCNFKKVCLHLFQDAQLVGKGLNRLVVYNYKEAERLSNGEYAHRFETQPEEYARLNRALQTCKATKMALNDARDCTKKICMLPRDPHTIRSAKLREMPHSLMAAKQLVKAQRTCERILIQLGNPGTKLDFTHAIFRTQASNFFESKDSEQSHGSEESKLEETLLLVAGNGHQEVMLEGLQEVVAQIKQLKPCPAFAAAYVKTCLIARGAAKALAMWRQLAVLERVYSSFDPAFAQALAALAQVKVLVLKRAKEGHEDASINPSHFYSLGTTLECSLQFLYSSLQFLSSS